MKSENNKKYNHIKYGIGKIIEDTTGTCKSDEVLFQPNDDSVFLGIKSNPNVGNWSYTNLAKFDIVKITELTKIN